VGGTIRISLIKLSSLSLSSDLYEDRVMSFTVMTGSGDSLARVYECKSGALLRTMKGHTTSINCIQVLTKIIIIAIDYNFCSSNTT